MKRQGFFAKSSLVNENIHGSILPQCGACGLYKECKSPKMPVTGKGKRGILVVAEAPGKTEDERNEQLIGDAGKLLRKQMQICGVDLDRDCWKTNAVICRPPDNKTPDEKKILACRPNLLKTIAELNPQTIILLGGTAIQSLIGYLWKESPGAVGRWVGWQIPCGRLNAWVCPTYHPSFLLRTQRGGGTDGSWDTPDEMTTKMFQAHLREALSLQGRPYERVPNYPQEVQVITSPKEAAKVIRRELQQDPRAAAFDYETNMLKPDSEQARIVSCAICFDGKTTLAFPWEGAAIEATTEFLSHPVLKIASSLRMEDRWSRKVALTRVTNWAWDTCLGAHLLDNRSDITGLKFQSFVMLGMEAYNTHVEGFLKASSASTTNRIDQIDLQDLLLYNGLDALLEYKVAQVQRFKLGMRRLGDV